MKCRSHCGLRDEPSLGIGLGGSMLLTCHICMPTFPQPPLPLNSGVKEPGRVRIAAVPELGREVVDVVTGLVVVVGPTGVDVVTGLVTVVVVGAGVVLVVGAIEASPATPEQEAKIGFITGRDCARHLVFRSAYIASTGY